MTVSSSSITLLTLPFDVDISESCTSRICFVFCLTGPSCPTSSRINSSSGRRLRMVGGFAPDPGSADESICHLQPSREHG